MSYLQESYKGLSLLVGINLDRLIYLGVLFASLLAGTYLLHP